MTGELCANLLRRLPARLAQILYYRFLRARAPRWRRLYKGAVPRFAPSCRMDLVPGDELSGAVAMTGVYELEVSRFVINQARRGGLLVDVGANLGYHSLLWAAAGDGCRALAVEASPDVFGLLQSNIAANPSLKIEAFHFAASDQSGTLRFAPSDNEQKGCGHVSADGPLEIPRRRIDEILADCGPVGLLKVDAEGHDLQVLTGASESIRKKAVASIVFESTPAEIASPRGRGVFEMLDESGYERPVHFGNIAEGVQTYFCSLKTCPPI